MSKNLKKKKQTKNDEKNYSTFYRNSNTETIINDQALISVYSPIKSKIEKSLEKGLCWIIDSVTHHTINISKSKSLSGSNYIALLKKLDHLRKILINIQNIDNNKFLKWCLVCNLQSVGQNPAIIRKTDKKFAKI